MHRFDRPGARMPVHLPALPQFGAWVSSDPSGARCQPLSSARMNAFSSFSLRTSISWMAWSPASEYSRPPCGLVPSPGWLNLAMMSAAAIAL